MDVTHFSDSQNIYLPASFLSSCHWATEQISASLAVAANITLQHSSSLRYANWPEIQSQLRHGQDFTDIPVVVIRVFKRKVALLEKPLKTMFPNAGGLLYCIHSIEFQKRGLPHVGLFKYNYIKFMAVF